MEYFDIKFDEKMRQFKNIVMNEGKIYSQMNRK